VPLFSFFNHDHENGEDVTVMNFARATRKEIFFAKSLVLFTCFALANFLFLVFPETIFALFHLKINFFKWLLFFLLSLTAAPATFLFLN
jgi:hypothetical protein